MAKAIINDMDISGTVAVDQQFNGSSANAQSGVAINGALTDYVKKSYFEIFDLTTATGAFSLSSYYCYKNYNNVHIECYGTVNQIITSAFNQPLIVIPTKYKPNTRYTTKVGGAGVDEDYYPSLAVVRTLDNGSVCLYQNVTGTLNTGVTVRFICDYIM